MITTAAKRKFINRPRKDYSWYKELSNEDIEARMRKLPIRPPIWSRLRRHQKVSFLLGARFTHWCFWNDTGTGKSLLSIALIAYFHALSKSTKKELVLVPNKVNKAEWAREVKKHSPKTKYCILRGASDKKWDQLRSTDATIIIETYAGLVRMLCELVKVKRKRKKKLKPSAKKVKEFLRIIEGPIFDESESISGHRSIAYRLCKKISWTSPHAFALNGTPFGRDVTPLWTQMHVIDKGLTLGETLGLFRSVFYREVEDPFGRIEYVFRRKKKALLHKWIANRSIRYKVDQSDLPERVPLRKVFKLPADARAYYDIALKALRDSQKKRLKIKETKNEFLRLRQLSSGFLGYHDDDEGKRAQLVFPFNPKLEICTSLIQEIVRGHKVVVFHDFTISGGMICDGLKKLGIPFARLYGKTKDVDAELAQFVDDPECRVFVVNNAAGGKGLNLQIARYVIFYESPVGCIMRTQAERRVLRQESEHKKTIIYDLTMFGGVDERILEFHKQGKSLLEAILDGKVSL